MKRVTCRSHIALRCDASETIGIGHAVRCLALATALRDLGCQCTLLMAEYTRFVADLAASYRIELRPLELRWSIPADFTATAVVIDHYQASCEYFRAWKQRGLLVAAIDDLAERDFSLVDWLLNPHPDAEQLPYRPSARCVCCFGPRYALLRPEFRARRPASPNGPSAPPRNIVITLGGSRNDSVLTKVLRSLENFSRPLSVRILLASGSDLPVNTSRHRIEVLHNVANMAEQLGWADIAITGAGSTCWEAACLGIPLIAFRLDDNQAANAAFLSRFGAAFVVDSRRDSDFERALGELLTDESRRKSMRAKARSLIDGRGAERAAMSLVSRIRQGSRL